jgi:hypothetical protein
VRPITWLATSWRRSAVLVGVAALSTWALFGLDARFARRTGAPTPDTQNGLTLERATAQLSSWDGGSTRLYLLFAAVDFVFPLAAALVLAVVAHRVVVLGNRGPGPVVPTGIALVQLLPVVFDYAENLGFLAAVATGGELPIRVALIMKALKLTSIGLAAGLLVVLVVVFVVRRVIVQVRKGGSAPS